VGEDGIVGADAATVEACGGFVLMTPQEYAAVSTWFPPLTISEGIAIGSAVLLLFAVAFIFKVLRRVISDSDPIIDRE
jgi:hypothetical protein